MENIKMTNRQLRQMYNALGELGKRSMATFNGDLKVGRFLKAVKDEAELQIGVRNKIAQRILGDAKLDDLSLGEQNKLNLQVMTEQEELDQKDIEISLPMDFVITQEDMPKEKSGAEGWKNADGLGLITGNLGPAFKWSEATPKKE